jgi:hypothetical protein
MASDSDCSGLNGYIEVVQLPRFSSNDHPASEAILERLLYRWYPPTSLREKLPDGYSIALESWRFRDGVRHLTPANPRQSNFDGYSFYDVTAFALEASVGGRALIWAHDIPNPYPSLSFEASRLFFQYAQHMQEHLGATRTLGRSLGLSAKAREDPGQRDVLPAEIGVGCDGSGSRWGIDRLKEEGRQAALDRGVASPTEDDIVRLGILRAAELHPLDIEDAGVEYVVRSVLFKLTPEKSADDAVAFVADKVDRSIKRRGNVTDEEFRKWIEDPKANLIRSIEKSAGAKLNRASIRTALLELAWQSVKLIGVTVDAQMRAIRDALPDGLNEQENFHFEQSYLSNPIFGGLPLILFHDRFDFLSEAIQDYWLDPTPNQVMKVRTMAYYYGEIVGSLRSSEARRKRPGGVSVDLAEPIDELEVVADASNLASSPMMKFMYDAARVFAMEVDVIPRDAGDEWLVSVKSFDDQFVAIEVSNAGKAVSVFSVDRSRFDELARRLSGANDVDS